MADIAGFWSYVRADDDSVGGAITKLAERLASEFELLSAESLRLFVDRENLEWGDEWKGRIDRELQETTFFIPIITPRYFQSDECRRELVRFKSAAERFGVKELLLPIYYVTVPEMEEPEPPDELMALVKSINREDMRKVRLANESDAVYRELVNSLARKLLTISRQTEGLPAAPAEAPESAIEASEGSGSSPPTGELVVSDESPEPSSASERATSSEEAGPPQSDMGSLEVLAAGEEALNRFIATIQELNQEMGTVSEIVQAATPEFSEATSFAQQLAITNKLAVQLDEPAENLTRIAQDYSANLITIDPAIQTLIEDARTNEEVREQKETRELFSAILGMVQVSQEGSTGMGELINVMEGPAAQSRELRQRLRIIQTALRNIADGREVFDDWESQLQGIYGNTLAPA